MAIINMPGLDIAPRMQETREKQNSSRWTLHQIPSDRPLGAQDADIASDFMASRTRYVRDVMRWLDIPPGETDFDRYDEPESHTLSLIIGRTINGHERAFVGLRATPIHDLDDSLSIHMWDNPRAEGGAIARQFESPEVQEFLADIAAEIKNPNGLPLNDITRLVPLMNTEQLDVEDPRKERIETHNSVIRLIGAIAGSAGLDSMLLFTSTPAFLSSMRRASLPYKVIVQGEISPERGEGVSSLCWSHLRTAWEQIKAEKPDQARLFAEGFAAAHPDHLMPDDLPGPNPNGAHSA